LKDKCDLPDQTPIVLTTWCWMEFYLLI